MRKWRPKQELKIKDRCNKCSKNISLFNREYAKCKGDCNNHFYCGPCFNQMLYKFDAYLAKDKTNINCWAPECTGKFDSECVRRFVKYGLEPVKAQVNRSKRQTFNKFKAPSDVTSDGCAQDVTDKQKQTGPTTTGAAVEAKRSD